MRPVEFSPEDIITAGNQLKEAGRNITGFALRKLVGGGNPTRLKQVWDEYESRQGAPEAEPVAELPVEVAEEMATVTQDLVQRLSVLATTVNDKAVKASERRVREVVRAAGEQREQAERELADASQTVDDLETKLDETLALVEQLKTELSVSHEKTQTQAVELAQVNERLALAERSVAAGNAHNERLTAQLETERQRHQDESAQLRNELAKSTARIEAANEERQRLQQETEQHRAEVSRVTSGQLEERLRHQQEIEQVRAELARSESKLTDIEQAHQEQRKANAQEMHLVVERMNKAESERDSLRTEAAIAREEAAKLAGQVSALQSQTADQLRALSDRNNVSSGEKQVARPSKPKAGDK
jgi:chromosome segregation ATPase